MVVQEIVISSDAGVHARPAMMLVREAMKYDGCKVWLIKDDIEADGKSIMSVLSLGISSGSKLMIKADGEGEEEIVHILITLIENEINKDD